jgi:competence protein ComGC
MSVHKNLKNSRSGFGLLEVVMGVGIISVLMMSIYLSLTSAVRNLGDSKQRSGAVALAQEKMEIIRHLAYDKIGTLNGMGPQGPMEDEEFVRKNGYNYQVNIEIRYKDDPFDGVFPVDTVNNDYKEVMVKVSWANNGQARSLEMFSTFIPNGIETDAGGGTMAINVIDSGGLPVVNAAVHLESIEDTPSVDDDAVTDTSGYLVFPGAAAQHYRVVVSKSGYETIRTYPLPPDSSFTPMNPDILINEDELNMKTFLMDKVANLSIKALNLADASGIENLSFQLRGGRKIGISPDTFSLDQTNLTNSLGDIQYDGISPGTYEIVNLSTLGNSQYYYIGCDSTLPIPVLAGASTAVNFLFADKSLDSLAIKVVDSSDGIPIEGATVNVTGTDFSQSVIVDADGVAYFPQSVEPAVVMVSADYQVEVSAPGFDSYSETVSVSDLVVKQIALNPL